MQNGHVLTKEAVAVLLGERKRNSSKGDHGRGLLIAGAPGMTGAAVMSATAALRAGAGTLKVVTTLAGVEALRLLPEAMTVSFRSNTWADCTGEFLAPYFQEATALCAGPGLGRDNGARAVAEQTLGAGKPTVLDADGLFALAQTQQKERILHKNVVLTPHFGEMARLTGLEISKIKAEQEAVARECAKKWGCTVLLKGPQSVIAAPDGRFAVNATGNAGLAKGGSGDVLSGISLALLCQGLAPFEAACAASYLLGASAEEAFALLGERMLLARDVTDAIERTIKNTL